MGAIYPALIEQIGQEGLFGLANYKPNSIPIPNGFPIANSPNITQQEIDKESLQQPLLGIEDILTAPIGLGNKAVRTTANLLSGVVIGSIDNANASDKGLSRYTIPNYGNRVDGTLKGSGYFGELPMQDGSNSIATEMSIGVDYGDGKETLVPLLNPSLSKDELHSLLKGDAPTDEMIKKTQEFGFNRLQQGKSPFVMESDIINNMR